MKEIDLMSSLHKATKRNYLERVNDKEYPKHKAATIAKKFSSEYWDGDRRICYGGYKFIPGRWTKVAEDLLNNYELPPNAKILDIGCGKGYLLYELKCLLPKAEVFGIDISKYAIDNCKEEVKEFCKYGNAIKLPWEDNSFDLVISINTLHNLYSYELISALKEMQRVGRNHKYLCVESYKTEEQKANLLFWQVTCEAFNTPEEWEWWFNLSGYTGDYSFIFFD